MESPASPAGKTAPTVMVVDDEPELLELLQLLLQLAGYRTLGAESGEDFLQQLQTQTPDLVLLDVMMPGMNGWEVLRQLKATPGWQDIPVAFVSALGTKADILQGLESGAVDYFVKPFDLDEVGPHLEWLARKSTPDEREIYRQQQIRAVRERA